MVSKSKIHVLFGVEIDLHFNSSLKENLGRF